MTIPALLDELHRRGIQLSVDGSKLVVRAPKAAWDSELRDTVRARKPEILAHLSGPTTAPDTHEMGRRAAEFRRQVDEWAESGRIGVPVVSLTAAPNLGWGFCCSCAVPLVDGETWRCATCVGALRLALEPR